MYVEKFFLGFDMLQKKKKMYGSTEGQKQLSTKRDYWKRNGFKWCVKTPPALTATEKNNCMKNSSSPPPAPDNEMVAPLAKDPFRSRLGMLELFDFEISSLGVPTYFVFPAFIWISSL